ncbi:MAG: energy transducer TonB [Rikenellaceae bacterium]
MEVKKSQKADLENKKSIFLLLGLAIALSLVIYLFNWSKPEFVIEVMATEQEIVEVEQVEITRQEEKKVEPPKAAAPVVSDVLKVVDNEIETETDLSVFDMENTEDMQIVIKDVGGEEEELVEEEAPMVIAETMPTFQGGTHALFSQWVAKNVRYPSIAEENNITGKVFIQFVVDKDGSVTNVVAMNAANVDKSLAEEAIRVVKKSPKWTPGEQRGQKVRVLINIPVVFNLQ